MTALQTLTATNKKLATTQNRISTGLRVSEASDNAAYWSISTTMQSDNKALSAVTDALGLGTGKVDTAYTAINVVKDAVDEIKKKLVAGKGASLEDQQKLQTEIKAYQNIIKSAVTNANYAGSNLLQNDGTATSDLKVTASYNRVGTTVTIDTINVAAADTQILDVAGTGGIVGGLLATTFFDSSTTRLDDAAVMTAIESVETAPAKLSTGAAILGAAKNTITLQTSFISKLSDAIDRGVGAMIDADMNAESARLSALQVQQQLGVQALSIANSNAQNILALFRN